MIDSIARHILGLHGTLALAIVFVVPLLESSAFVGFVFPGEIAVILGGVLAFQHRVGLAAVLAAAIAGAVVGDSVGYEVGHRYGRRLLSGRVGRLVRDEHRQRAERHLAERGGTAVFLGRFTAALRVLVPGLAGMARMPYRTFLIYNVAGGAIWATGMVFLGYLAGASWQRAAHWASRVGLVLLGLIVLGFAARYVLRAAGRRAGRQPSIGGRLATTAPARWARRRFPAQLDWLRRRLDPAAPDGLARTTAVATAALAAWLFGGLTQDVTADEGLARLDPAGHTYALAHRTGWLTAVMRAVTWLGSGWLIVPALAAATLAAVRWRRPRGVGRLWAAYLGAVTLYALAKPLVHRPRPPGTDLIGAASGPSYPSGHATQALAVWGMLAILAAAGRPARIRVTVWACAAVVVLLVGASRIYLGAHWPTDVLAGYTLGAGWLAVLLALHRHGQQPAATPDTGRATPPTGPTSQRGQPPAPPQPIADTPAATGEPP
jgi:membrane protein DedA with SNARE-associated domain/membrane-associated phospholipid phosphatase